MQKDEVLKQSEAAYNMWHSLWVHNSTVARSIPKIPMSTLKNQGNGKHLIIISMGGSFEKQVDIIKEYQGKVDIMAVDKAFGACIEHGIRPDFVLIADAQVSFQCYCEPYLKHTSDIILLSNVNANPDWALNWKGLKSYYVNKDNIQSEKEFSAISGVADTIHAGSNVSNAALIYANSVLNYDKYILLGFDFCWDINGKFYSFANGTEKMGNKSSALSNMRVLDYNYNMVNCSDNLWFSGRWLDMYIRAEVGDKALNASEGIMEVPKRIDLKKYLSEIKEYKRTLTHDEVNNLTKRKLIINDKASFEKAYQIMSSKDSIVLGGQLEWRTNDDLKIKDCVINKYS